MVIFREKLEKLSWGWAEGINDWNSPWESALSLPCGDIYALSSNPNPIVHGGTFLILVDVLVRRGLEVPACFNRKKKKRVGTFCLLERRQGARAPLCLLDAEAASPEEAECGSRKPALNLCSSRLCKT